MAADRHRPARVARRHVQITAGLAIVAAMGLFCWVGPLLYSTNQTDVQRALLAEDAGACPCPPSTSHPLGTDQAGFDVLGRLMYAGRSSMVVGLAAATLATLVGVVYGCVSGFVGGSLDAAMMRLLDALMSIPLLFLLLTLGAVFQPSTLLMIAIISFTAWLVPARLMRGETLALRHRSFVEAARAIGASRRRVVIHHIVPNAAGVIAVNSTMQVADAILALAALGFLGLGLPPPRTDWGAMVSDGVAYTAENDWWLIYPAGLCIVVTIVGVHLLAGGLHDELFVTRRP